MHGAAARGWAAWQPEDARLLLDEDAQDFLAALAELEARATRGAGPGRAHRAARLLLGPREGRRAAAGRHAAALRDAQAPARGRARGHPHRHPGLVPLRRAHADEGRAARAGLRDRVAAPRATRGAWSSSPPARRTRTRRSRTRWAAATSRHHLASGLLGDADRSRRRPGDALRGVLACVRAHGGGHGGQQRGRRSTPRSATTSRATATWCSRTCAPAPRGCWCRGAAPAGAYYFVDPARPRGGGAGQGRGRGAPRGAGAGHVPGEAPAGGPAAHRRGGGARAGATTVLEETRLRDAPFSDDPVKGGARRRRPCWTVGLTGGYQSFFDAPTREHALPLRAACWARRRSCTHYFRERLAAGASTWRVGGTQRAAGAAHAGGAGATATRC